MSVIGQLGRRIATNAAQPPKTCHCLFGRPIPFTAAARSLSEHSVFG